MDREGYFISKQIAGYSAIFCTQGKEWFHFAIPTPVIIGGCNSTLQKVFVLYKTTLGAKITAVHVYDGVTKFQAFDKIELEGDHSKNLDNSNTWPVKPVHIRFGLGISVNVDFGKATPKGVPEIRFVSAGADFVIPL
jgi:hypothetical protein